MGPAQAIVVDWIEPGEAGAITTAWRRLEAGSVTPNVFHGPDFLIPQIEAMAAGAELLVLSDPSRHALAAVMPVAPVRYGFGLAGAIPSIWSNEYGPAGTPLLSATDPVAIWTVALDALVERSSAAAIVNMRLDGPVYDALLEAAEAGGQRLAVVDRHERAVLAPAEGATDYLAQAVPGKRRKEWGRLRRRLGERGNLVSDVAATPAEVEAAFGMFLELEAAGWKGRAGTAMAQLPAVCGFARRAVSELAWQGRVAIDRLMLDGSPAALLVRLAADGHWCAWKIAYDEVLAPYSPGLLVTLDGTERMLADPHFVMADSLAVENHPMIDHIWRERMPVGTVLVELVPGSLKARIGGADLAAFLALKRTARNARDRFFREFTRYTR